MNNIKELRNEMVNVFNSVKADKMDLEKAAQMNNTAGKIVKTLKIQLEYFHQRDEKPQIDFLKCR